MHIYPGRTMTSLRYRCECSLRRRSREIEYNYCSKALKLPGLGPGPVGKPGAKPQCELSKPQSRASSTSSTQFSPPRRSSIPSAFFCHYYYNRTFGSTTSTSDITPHSNKTQWASSPPPPRLRLRRPPKTAHSSHLTVLQGTSAGPLATASSPA